MQVVLMLKSDLRTDSQKKKKQKTQANQSVFFSCCLMHGKSKSYPRLK